MTDERIRNGIVLLRDYLSAKSVLEWLSENNLITEDPIDLARDYAAFTKSEKCKLDKLLTIISQEEN